MTRFRRVAIHARGDDAEPLRARLLTLVPSGLEERSLGDELELAAYVAVDDVNRVLAEFPEAVVTDVPEGWADAWRGFHRPVTAGGLWIGPPWEPAPRRGRTVVIDPGRAFGTGAHPTTRLCVELLATSTSRGRLLDVGCGSGALAIAGVRLGFDPVVAVDQDPVAVETTRANARANQVALDVHVADAVRDTLPETDVAVANVLLRPVETILARLRAREAITSGYLAGERPAHDGWTHVECVELEGWAADRFIRSR